MKAYTLEQLSHFTDSGMDRQLMLRSMVALGVDEDASFALRSADATRDGDLVGLYWDYGGQYGAQLEALIDWHLAQEPDNPRAVAAAVAPRYALGQLAWVHATGMFQSDVARDMLALGVPEIAVQDLTQAAAAHRTVIGVWKACGQSHAAGLEAYLAKCLESYPSGWPHMSASAEPTSGSNLEQLDGHGPTP
jgi:hypothetical protein